MKFLQNIKYLIHINIYIYIYYIQEYNTKKMNYYSKQRLNPLCHIKSYTNKWITTPHTHTQGLQIDLQAHMHFIYK